MANGSSTASDSIEYWKQTGEDGKMKSSRDALEKASFKSSQPRKYQYWALIHHLVGQSTLNKCASRKTIQVAFPVMDL